MKAVGDASKLFKVGDKVRLDRGAVGMAKRSSCTSRMNARPDFTPFEEAAALLDDVRHVALCAEGSREDSKGETLLVLGAAGWRWPCRCRAGRGDSATVIAAASTQEKVDFAISKGRIEGFVYPQNPLNREQQKEFSDKIKRTGRRRRRRGL